MKKALIIALAAVFVFSMAGIAMAELAGASYPYAADGSSYWTYKDNNDGTAKNEGGYKKFDSGTLYTLSPHGGYDTTTNKCKVCHAVHRAAGAYFLLRSDTQDDACDYCHIGGSAHSNKVVYQNGDPNSIANGHTIGASATIPDSSVYQTTENVTLSTVDADGNAVTEVVAVRRYNNNKNKMFRFARHHGHGAASTGRSGYLRIGPLALRCMNCHQPHNATNMIWKPKDFSDQSSYSAGYKLLRLMPSASIQGTTTLRVKDSSRPANDANTQTITIDYNNGMQNYSSYLSYKDSYDGSAGETSADCSTLVNTANAVKVPETTMSASNTGPGKTIYTTYLGVTEAAHQHGADRDPQTVNQYALSPWCADCHNLNIGYWTHLHEEELGFKSHADRTHPAPYTGAYNGPAQCYSCHRNDLPTVLGNTTGAYGATSTKPALYDSRGSCEQCHFGTGSYAATIASVSPGTDSGYDFPHSGNANSIKLLGDYSVNPSQPTTPTATNITANNIDAVCIRCHGGIGVNH